MTPSADDPAASPLRSLLRPKPKWQVLESRKTQWQDSSSGATISGDVVYVQMDFGKPDSAPLFGEGLLQKVIVGITLQGAEKLYLSAQAVPKSSVLQPNPPLRVIGAQWNTVFGEGLGSFDTLVGYNILGGVPPYRSETVCGNLNLEKIAKRVATPQNVSLYGAPQETPTDHIVIQLPEPRGQRFPISCVVKIVDSHGAQDEASFAVPELHTQLWAPFCWVRNPWYGWGQGIPNARQGCSKLAVLNAGSTKSSGTFSTDVQPSPPEPISPALPTASCGDYQACLGAGITAFASHQWEAAIADFQQATVLDASKPSPWAWMGGAFLSSGRGQQATGLWDKALHLGGPVVFRACHERALQPCETGSLVLGFDAVSFVKPNREKVFGAPPSQVSSKGTLSNSAGHVSFGVQVAGKNYNFDFLPAGVACQTALFPQCPPEGITQQSIVSKYVSQTIPKLASGSFGSQSLPSESPTSLASTSTCVQAAQAVDLGYSILLQGRLYSIKVTGPAGPNQMHLFFDQKGTLVTDTGLLQQLAPAAWTRENVVVVPDARNGSSRLSSILGTSRALQGYSAVQDALARVMVEAVEAGATGGASLSKAFPNLTVSMLKSQLQNAPKTLLTLAAQRGLEMSADAYKQMDAVPLPPADATALSATDLARVKDLYFQAHSLELPYVALAAKLMPKTTTDLTDQALKSAFSELIAGPVFSGASPTDKLTLDSVLKLMTSVGNLSTSLPGLQEYSQNLNLALKLAAANNHSISLWTTPPSGCTQAVAGTPPTHP